MKILGKILIYSSFFILGSCAARDNFLTEHKDIWIQDHDKGLFYCRANTSDNGLADPTCFEAGFTIFDGNVKTKKKNN